MTAFSTWTGGDFESVIRREMMDTGSRWISQSEIYFYLGQWLNDLQQEFEFVWAVNTLTVGTITSSDGTAPPICIISTSTFNPPMLRNEAVYYNSFRLSGRFLQDLEVGNPVWRGQPGVSTPFTSGVYDIPRAAVMYPDSQSILIWPCPPPPGSLPPGTNSNVFVFEYPVQINTFTSSTNTTGLPIWTQWSAKAYVCAKLYQRPGPINDSRKAARYAAQYQRARLRIRRMWDSFLPERFRRLQPGQHYEWNILTPPPAWDLGTDTAQGTTTNVLPFITLQSSGNPVSVASNRYRGFNFTVGTAPIFVTGLGRWCISGNSQAHSLYLMQGSMVLASGTINLSTGVVGQYNYIGCGQTLEPGGNYDLMCSEIGSGDTVYNGSNVTISTATDAIYNFSEAELSADITMPPVPPFTNSGFIYPMGLGIYNLQYYTF